MKSTNRKKEVTPSKCPLVLDVLLLGLPVHPAITFLVLLFFGGCFFFVAFLHFCIFAFDYVDVDVADAFSVHLLNVECNANE